VKAAILRKVRESARDNEEFFEAHTEQIEACARAMAERFLGDARLFSFGNGGSACDAQHMAVEFLHPIVEKRRALPAVSLTTDTSMLTAVGNDTDFSRIFVDQLQLLARPNDIAVGISTSGKSANVVRAFQLARKLEMLTIALTGKDGGRLPELAQYCFVVSSYSIHRIQEVHVTLLHILWDLVHIALGENDVL